MSNKEIAEDLAYWLAQKESHEICDPSRLEELIEERLNKIL
jgi:hypothetical protein